MQFCARCWIERTATPCPGCGVNDAPWTPIANGLPGHNDRCDVQFTAGGQRADWRFRDGGWDPPANEQDYERVTVTEVGAWRPHNPAAQPHDYLTLRKKVLLDRRGEGIGVVRPKRKT